jgi:hypothetical protein
MEIPVTVNGQGRVNLPDTAQLRSTTDIKIILKSMRLITDPVLTNSVLVAGVTAPFAELQKMSLTIYAEGWEKGQTIPILTLNDMETPGTLIPFKQGPTYFDNWINVDWPKSYIQYSNGTVSAGVPYVVLIDIQYLRLNAQEKVVYGPAK